MKDNRVWCAGTRMALAALLCLPCWAFAAEPVVPATGGEMETVSQVPEGYHPLPVTEFEVDVEKNDAYGIAVGVEYPGKPSDARKWLKKNITGRIELYRRKDNKLISTHFVFNKQNEHYQGGVDRAYLNRIYLGEAYSLSLIKGKYIIVSRLFFKGEELNQKPRTFISFERVRTAWW